MADNCAKLYSMTNTTIRTNLSGAPALVSIRATFNCNDSLTSTVIYRGYGRLPQEHVGDLCKALDNADLYLVYSYDTPIAWFANGVWTVPNVKYSPTTSRHQTQVRRGIHA